MEADERFARMCGDKVRFSRRDAEQRAESLGLRAYQCPYCEAHHLGPAARWTRKERALRKKALQRAGRERRKRYG